MKLLFFSSMRGAPWGGSEELWAAAARRALADGHQVSLCLFNWRPRPAQVVELVRLGAQLITRPLRVPRWRALAGRPAWLRELDTFNPDAVCLSQGSAYECVGRRTTRPLLAWLEQRPGVLVNLIQFNEPKPQLKKATQARALRLFERGSVNGFVAARNIDEASRTLGRDVPRARVLRNPVNLADTSMLPWPGHASAQPLSGTLPPTPPTPSLWEGGPELHSPVRFACVGRLHVDAKGQDLLLAALGAQPWQARNWRLSLFGTGKGETSLRHQATQLAIADRVIFAGSTADIRGVWSSHHLLVLPSRAEGTPLAMVEAMLLGRPCVVTDVGGCTEWVREGLEGWVADTATVAAIDGALKRAWAARARWPAIGEAARRRALECWDPDPGRTVLQAMLGLE